jgi:hypothetical protein
LIEFLWSNFTTLYHDSFCLGFPVFSCFIVGGSVGARHNLLRETVMFICCDSVSIISKQSPPKRWSIKEENNPFSSKIPLASSLPWLGVYPWLVHHGEGRGVWAPSLWLLRGEFPSRQWQNYKWGSQARLKGVNRGSHPHRRADPQSHHSKLQNWKKDHPRFVLFGVFFSQRNLPSSHQIPSP